MLSYSYSVLQYKVTREELNTATLWLSVWDWDVMGRNRFLGEVLLPIFKKNFDLSSSRIIKYTLQVRGLCHLVLHAVLTNLYTPHGIHLTIYA